MRIRGPQRTRSDIRAVMRAWDGGDGCVGPAGKPLLGQGSAGPTGRRSRQRAAGCKLGGVGEDQAIAITLGPLANATPVQRMSQNPAADRLRPLIPAIMARWEVRVRAEVAAAAHSEERSSRQPGADARVMARYWLNRPTRARPPQSRPDVRPDGGRSVESTEPDPVGALEPVGRDGRPGARSGTSVGAWAAIDHLRHRTEFHVASPRGLGLPARRAARLHPSQTTRGESLHRVIQRAVARRVSERPPVRLDRRMRRPRSKHGASTAIGADRTARSCLEKGPTSATQPADADRVPPRD
jgi:hypothetical protein